MDFVKLLEKTAEENKTVLCFGIDPDLEKMTAKETATGKKTKNTNPKEAIESFFFSMADRLIEDGSIAAIKPNYAFFAQHGFDGLHALKSVIDRYKNKIPVILDAKRGDIGKTGEAYAREVYDFWGADAVTVSPYMGTDSMKPFLREGKLPYVLCRTSNPGAEDIQELACGNERVYEKVARKAVDWKCGIVVGATSDSIKNITKITGGKVPMLIPGIGAQGGDLKLVLDAIASNPHIHRINLSSSLSYAFEKSGKKPEDAAAAEAEKLNSEIRKNPAI